MMLLQHNGGTMLGKADTTSLVVLCTTHLSQQGSLIRNYFKAPRSNVESVQH